MIVLGNLNNFFTPVRERIFTLLKSRAISQKAFSEAIKVTDKKVSDWNTGRSSSFMKQLDVIADALGTTEEWLLYGGDAAPPGKAKPIPVSGDGLDAEEQQLIHDYRTLNTQGQEYIRQTMHMAVQTYKKSPDLSKLEGQG